MASDGLLDVMFSLPSRLHTPSLGAALAVVVPPAHMPVPFGTGVQSGWRSGPGPGQAQQPLDVCDGDPPACVDVPWSLPHAVLWMGPLVSALFCWWPRVFSSLLPCVREQRSVEQAQAWGRCPATRGRGRVGSVGTTPPA